MKSKDFITLRDSFIKLFDLLIDERDEEEAWRCPDCKGFVSEGCYCGLCGKKSERDVVYYVSEADMARNGLREELRSEIRKLIKQKYEE